ncbi:MAG: sugar ABC transporter substrate-binding protein [Eubacterium sp.]|jgi:ABC-type sugar transport system, periplasmic component|nr:sugar ABC transporter substrate-binding protein [Eubacterium sp.]
MNNSGKWFHVIEAVLAVMVILMAAAMLLEKNSKQYRKISVVIQDAEDTQWAAFRYGLKMAAQDQKVELVVASTADVLTKEEQLNTIKREIELGADAVIVQPVPGDDLEQKLKHLEKKVPIMLVEYTAAKEREKSQLPSVEPDHSAMGEALAEELKKDYCGNLSGKKYGILMKADAPHAMNSRRQGVEKALQDTGIVCSWVVDGSVENKPEVDIVIALDNNSLIKAAEQAAANNLHGALVYGIGNSTQAAYYLDTGSVECLVVPDEFSVGYYSLTEAAERLRHFFRGMKSRVVAYTVIRREELFEERNQEILFTMCQ